MDIKLPASGGGVSFAYSPLLNDQNGNRSDYAAKGINDAASGVFTTYFFPELSTISEAFIDIFPGGVLGATEDVDFSTEYGSDTEVYNQHSEADTSSTIDLSNGLDRHHKIDISSVFTSPNPGDIIGFKLTNNTGTVLRIVIGYLKLT